MENQGGKNTKKLIYASIITVSIFWILDFVLHFTGVGETNYYYLSKLGNSILFAIIWFFIFNKGKHWQKLLFSVVFGTWISFYYLATSYSGFAQWLGFYARYSPPPFVIFGIFLAPILWWVFHSLSFYVGVEIADRITKK
jgi:hypothetical protein